MFEMKELKVPAVIENVEKVTAFVDEYLESVDFPLKSQLQIDIAIDEVFSNIAYYSYGDDCTGDAIIRIIKIDDPQRIELSFVDNGIAYNPLMREDPNINLSSEDREVGGLGIFIVKKSMDDVKYEYTDGQNILTLIKYF